MALACDLGHDPAIAATRADSNSGTTVHPKALESNAERGDAEQEGEASSG